MSEPARRYSWPAFEPGNPGRPRHQARSPRAVQPIADDLLVELEQAAPWTRAPAFAAERAAWAWNEARCLLLRAWIDEHGVLSDNGRDAAGELHRAENRAASARRELGLTPQSMAKLLTALAIATSTGTGDQGALDALKAVGRSLVKESEV